MPDQLRESVYWSAQTAAAAIQFETVPVDDTLFDVIIVGASYTGLNAAIELARAGRTGELVDPLVPAKTSTLWARVPFAMHNALLPVARLTN